MAKISRSKLMFSAMLLFVLTLAACGNDDTADEKPTDDSDAVTEESAEEGSEEKANESAETEPKVTEFEPAFPEQTRAPAVKTETEIETEVVVEGLGVSWGMAEFEPNRLLVTQRDAAELLIVNLEDGAVSDPIEGTPEVNNEDQGGLLDVAVKTCPCERNNSKRFGQ